MAMRNRKDHMIIVHFGVSGIIGTTKKTFVNQGFSGTLI